MPAESSIICKLAVAILDAVRHIVVGIQEK
jgi:hypothetical protein